MPGGDSIVWSHLEPLPIAAPIENLVAFYNEVVDIAIDRAWELLGGTHQGLISVLIGVRQEPAADPSETAEAGQPGQPGQPKAG